MKANNIVIIVPLVSAMTIGTAFAQGNPHRDPIGSTQQLASIHGNPHLGFEVSNTVAMRYQGNPHEGYISKVVRVSASPGNPHNRFKMVPLTVASSE